MGPPSYFFQIYGFLGKPVASYNQDLRNPELSLPEVCSYMLPKADVEVNGEVVVHSDF